MEGQDLICWPAVQPPAWWESAGPSLSYFLCHHDQVLWICDLGDFAFICLGSSVNAWISEPSLNDVGEFIKPLVLSLPRHWDMWLRLAQIPRAVLQVLCPSTHVGRSWTGVPSAGRPSHKHSLSRGTSVCESYVPNIHCFPEAALILTTCLAFSPSTTTNKKSSFLSVDPAC